MTKETLLKYNGFTDNEFLDKYLELVNSRLVKERDWDGADIQCHHIIPVCWYKLNYSNKVTWTDEYYRTLASNDINQEYVKFNWEEHIQAHKLLLDCTTGEFQAKLACSYGWLLIGYIREQKNKNDPKYKLEKRETKVQKPTVTAHRRNKEINAIAKKLWRDRNWNCEWEEVKAIATKQYEQSK